MFEMNDASSFVSELEGNMHDLLNLSHEHINSSYDSYPAGAEAEAYYEKKLGLGKGVPTLPQAILLTVRELLSASTSIASITS